jgi:Holliday junction resolvase
MSRGHDRERAVARLLADEAWWVARAAGSLGDADLVALRAGFPPRLIEVKSTSKPYERFGPAERTRLRGAARRAGAEAWLAWWPIRKREPVWLHELDWPDPREVAA